MIVKGNSHSKDTVARKIWKKIATTQQPEFGPQLRPPRDNSIFDRNFARRAAARFDFFPARGLGVEPPKFLDGDWGAGAPQDAPQNNATTEQVRRWDGTNETNKRNEIFHLYIPKRIKEAASYLNLWSLSLTHQIANTLFT